MRSIDVAHYTGFSKPSISRAVGLLRDNGYVSIDQNGLLGLTESGMQIATSIYERHTVLTAFLTALGVDAETAAEDACRIEHVLSEETFPVEITEDGQAIEITMENQIIRGTVETTKVDADFPENTLSGAIFEVYADVDHNGEFDPDIDKLAGEMAESEGGVYQLKDLQYGDYFLHEEGSP